MIVILFLGVDKTLLRAKETVSFPYITKHIRDVIMNCPARLTFKNSQQKEPLINREVATRPWQIIGTDLFYFNEKQYLLIVDTYFF